MKKIILGLILVSFLIMNGCKVETGTSFGLTIEDAILARQNREGKLTPVPDGVFKRGENVNFVLLNVGKFKKGEDGKHWLDMDIEVKAPDDTVLFAQQGMMGEKGHTVLENGIASSPYGTYFTTSEYGLLKAGKYRIKLTIHDKIGGGSASKSKTFTLVE